MINCTQLSLLDEHGISVQWEGRVGCHMILGEASCYNQDEIMFDWITSMLTML